MRGSLAKSIPTRALGPSRVARTLGVLAAVSVGHAARGADDSVPQTSAQTARLVEVEASAGSNAHAYSDVPEWRAAPAAALEFGYGNVIPTLKAPAQGLLGRLGVAIEAPDSWALVLAGESGVALAFNTGGSSPNYGYVVRVPLAVAFEVIRSQLLDYRHQRYLNFHAALDGGPEFLLAAQCTSGACKYITPSTYEGVGLRLGVSYSALTRSSIGAFVTWHNDFAGCTESSSTPCFNWLSTLMWSIGWTLF